MRIACIERFVEPSRRCDRHLVAGDHDEIVVWDLDRTSAGYTPTWSEVACAIPAWASLATTPSRLVRYLRACNDMRGWRRMALVHLPAWIRQARAHKVDLVACFSADHFPLAELLAAETGLPCREQLATGTQYLGEFAFELLAVVPYAYWLHEQGRLEYTVSTEDTQCLYYFSSRHIEHPSKRRYVPITEYPVGERGEDEYDHPGFPEQLDTSRWRPPPYRQVYADDRFQWSKPTVVIVNKTSDEHYLGHDFAVNAIPTGVLLSIVAQLVEQYTVVYDRPRESDMVGDHAAAREIGDIEAVKQAFPEVVTIQELQARHPDLTFNELQLRLFAGCDRFVSVLGGGSYLASYFGGTNVVYAQEGWEIDCHAYEGWFHKFSGARVVATRTPTELLGAIEEHFLANR